MDELRVLGTGEVLGVVGCHAGDGCATRMHPSGQPADDERFVAAASIRWSPTGQLSEHVGAAVPG